MKKIPFILPLFLLTLMGCGSHDDDFAFSGVVVNYEMCNSIQDLGYVVQITSPDSIGGDYINDDGSVLHHIIVVYNSDRILRDQDSIGGRIYYDLGHSKAECNYHYRQSTGDVPEACFSKIEILN